MPSNDVIVNLKQIAGYTETNPLAGDVVVVQRGGLGGPYLSMTVQALVSDALAAAGPMSVGNQAPADTASPQLFTDGLSMVLDGQLMWNCYVGGGLEKMVAAGAGGRIVVGLDGSMVFQYAQATGAQSVAKFNTTLNISPTGYLTAGEQLRLGRDPAAPMEAATSQWVTAQINASLGLLQSLYSTATVWSFNRRIGNIILNLNDVMGAGGAPIFSPAFQGEPTAPTPSPASNSGDIATTAWVWQTVGGGAVASFNGRTGVVVLTTADVTGVGGLTSSSLTAYAPLASPAFSGVPTAPTAAVGVSTGQIATTAFVMSAVTSSVTGVASFNTRTGAVVLTGADVTSAGGALLASPTFIGVPIAPTAAPGTNTGQIATTAFVMAGSVASFNTRTGAVVLTGADLTAAGGALLASPAFTGGPTAPTAAPGSNTTQIATTAFVVANTVASWNGRTGAVTLQTNDVSAVGGALLASPTFTGTPSAPTATAGTSTTQIATTAFVSAAIGTVGGVASFNGRAGAVTLQSSDVTGVGGALLASPTFTGTPAAPTALPTDNSTTIATTAYVQAAIAKAATVAPLMDGTAAVGTSLLYARQDHVHPSDTSRLPAAGVTNGSDAPAGQIGEVISSNVTAAVTLTTATQTNLTSIALTAGDWDVCGEVWITIGAGGGSIVQGGINSVSAIIPAASAIATARSTSMGSFPASTAQNFALRPCRVSIAGSTTYYLIAYATFPSGTTTATGNIWARRAR